MGGVIINNYSSENRGTFQNTEYAEQLVYFDGMRFEGENGVNDVTPTDIDGLIQLTRENCFIFFELKHSGSVPYGQKMALEKLCDGLEAGGVNSVAIVATHHTPQQDPIIARDAKVEKVYWKGEWKFCKGNPPLLWTIQKYIEKIRELKDR